MNVLYLLLGPTRPHLLEGQKNISPDLPIFHLTRHCRPRHPPWQLRDLCSTSTGGYTPLPAPVSPDDFVTHSLIPLSIPSFAMSEPATNGGASPSLDLAATERALASSSTAVRIAQLRSLDDLVAQNCTSSPSLPVLSTS